MNLQDIQRIAQKMVFENAERNRAFEAYTQMYHNGWDLPQEVKNLPWIQRVISSDPHDAINTGSRILATLPVSIRYQPLAPGTKNKERADMIERVLLWQLKSADRRRSKTVAADVVKSALLYDAVALQVIDLDHQIKEKTAINASAKRELAARRYSRFIVKTHNPMNVYARYSGIMPEAVLLVDERPAQGVIDEWGDRARALPGLQNLAEKTFGDEVTYFDYWDLEKRAVWVVPGRVASIPESTVNENWVIVEAEDNKMPFLPWVAVMGGSTLEAEPQHMYQPLLYALWTTGAWDIQNIVESLMASEVIARSGSPRLVEEGPNPQQGETDYLSPERIAKMPGGNTLRELNPQQIDQALQQIDALMAARIDKATVSRVLQGGDLPSGMAFATLNLATQNAVGVLKPAKDLAEKSLAEMFTLMLLWTEFSDVPMLGYSVTKDTMGEQMVIEPEEIDPGGIYLECELHPDAPTDRAQRVNTAAMAVKELMMPIEEALEEIGITDPSKAMLTRMKEVYMQHFLDLQMQKEIQEMQAGIQLQMQQATMQMQMEMQQAQMEMQQAQMGGMGGMGTPPNMGPGGAPPPSTGGIQAGPNGSPRGMGAAPSMGGQPPAMMAPNETREMISGQDITGQGTELPL